MTCNKRMNVAHSLSDVRCSVMAHYILFSETICSTLHKVQSKVMCNCVPCSSLSEIYYF